MSDHSSVVVILKIRDVFLVLNNWIIYWKKIYMHCWKSSFENMDPNIQVHYLQSLYVWSIGYMYGRVQKNFMGHEMCMFHGFFSCEIHYMNNHEIAVKFKWFSHEIVHRNFMGFHYWHNVIKWLCSVPL